MESWDSPSRVDIVRPLKICGRPWRPALLKRYGTPLRASGSPRLRRTPYFDVYGLVSVPWMSYCVSPSPPMCTRMLTLLHAPDRTRPTSRRSTVTLVVPTMMRTHILGSVTSQYTAQPILRAWRDLIEVVNKRNPRLHLGVFQLSLTDAF